MRTPEEIAAQITTRYRTTWRDWLAVPPAEPLRFTLRPPTGREVQSRPGGVDAWLRSWHEWVRQHPGTQLRSRSVATPFGPQQVFTHLDVTGVDALAAVEGTTATHWAAATERWQHVLRAAADVDAVRPHLARLVEMPAADFTILLRAVRWFRDNPRSGRLPRQVPVEGMHTKWLARHRGVVLAVLGSSAVGDRPEDDELEQSDLDALGLVAAPAEVDVLLADPADAARTGGLTHVRAPVPELAGLPLTPRVVLVVENKESAQLVPQHPGLVVVHSLGNHLDALAALPWLHGVPALYWGDLDRAGFTLLSRAREFLPGLRSVLMDRPTLEQHVHLAVPDTTRADPPRDTLTAAEQQALRVLTGGAGDGAHLRLEQERLPEDVVSPALQRALEGCGDLTV